MILTIDISPLLEMPNDGHGDVASIKEGDMGATGEDDQIGGGDDEDAMSGSGYGSPTDSPNAKDTIVPLKL